MKRILVALITLLALSLGVVGAHAATKPKKEKPPAEPTELAGQVSRIVDGDTLWLKTAPDAEPVVIRIEGIDAPESCQAGGADATQALTQLALHRNVTVRIVARDEHARIVGKVFDGTVDVGDRMVRDGRAWSARFKYDRGPYVAEERMAMALKRGLHGEPGAVLPREFRQRNGECAHPAGAPKKSAAAPAPVVVADVTTSSAGRRCDGRLYCSQMASCDEATWFQKNCPGTKMDGDNDGVPCETQWCNKR